MPTPTQVLGEESDVDATEHTSTLGEAEDVGPEESSFTDGNSACSGGESDASTANDCDGTPKSAGESDGANPSRLRTMWHPSPRLLLHAFAPALALILAVGAGYLKWQDMSYRQAKSAAAESVQAATDATVAMLTYHHETVEKDLNAARDRLAGSFRDDYTKLIDTVVIPGSKEKNVSVIAKVSQAGAVSATANHAVVLVFVDQTTTFGSEAPTDSASSVLVTLDKQGGKWLVSKFEPV